MQELQKERIKYEKRSVDIDIIESSNEEKTSTAIRHNRCVTHSLTHSLISYSLTHLLTHSLTYFLLTHLLIYSLTEAMS